MKIPRVKIISKSTGPAKAKKVALNLQTLSKLFMKIKELKIKFKQPINQPTNKQILRPSNKLQVVFICYC